MSTQTRSRCPVFLVISGVIILLAAGVFLRQAEAAVTIECEVLVEEGDGLMPGQAPDVVVGINVEEDGEVPDVEAPEIGAPPPAPGPPEIVYLDPNAGGPDLEVTIFGWNFDPAIQVTFDGTDITPENVIPGDPAVPEWDQIVIITPALDPGAVDVTVTNPVTSPNVGTDTLTDGFTYLFPSPFPGWPGSSSLRWVEVVIATNILDNFLMPVFPGPDTDGDRMSDFDETRDLDPATPGVQNPFDPNIRDSTGDNFQPGPDGIADGWNDWDGDGIRNADEFIIGYNPTDPGDAALFVEDFRNYLDGVFHELTIWVDGMSDLEDENGVFIFQPVPTTQDDRPLIPLMDIDESGLIDDFENQRAEVYENFIPGSRASVFSFARNPGLGDLLRAAMAGGQYEPPVSEMDMLPEFREESNLEIMDQIVYRFACAWPSHRTPPRTERQSGFVEIGPQFEVPGLGWPEANPAAVIGGTIPSHDSNQYLGPAGGDEGLGDIFFEGNDYFVTIQPGCNFPADAILNVRVIGPTPEDPIFGWPEHPPGIQTDPPPEEDIEGCDTEASIGTAGGGNIVLNVDPVPYRTRILPYMPEHLRKRIRPDVVGTAVEGHSPWEVHPRILQMEYPTAVIAINAHGGDPSDLATAIFIDRITVTFTDVGGGAQFGRLLANTFAGDGDFNPWFGLDEQGSMSAVGDVVTDMGGRPPGYRGVDVYRDSDGDGDLDPESDIVYNSEVWVIPGMINPWEPYHFIADPGHGVSPLFRDDPEWTIVLDMTSRVLGTAPRTPYDPTRYEGMDEDNFADFALEAVPDEPDDDDMVNPDFFIAVQLDSGYRDMPGANWIGDGTGIEYGADFRAYIKPALITDLDDPLNQLAIQAELPKFPAGIVFSNQRVEAGGLGCELLQTTLPEMSSPPYSGVMQVHDYVVNAESWTRFHHSPGLPAWETVPFFLPEDTQQLGGPRSPFFRVPPLSPRSAAHGFLDFGWMPPPGQWPGFTLYEERNFFEDDLGTRVLAQRVDSLSLPVAMLGLNVVNTPDEVTLTFNDLKVARIECYIVSEDRRGPTGFEPSDLMAIADDGLGNTGISLWEDGTADGDLPEFFAHVGDQSSGTFDISHDTQVPLMLAEISDTPEPIEMDGIPQDRDDDGVADPDLWGYRVVLEPVDAFNVPQNDVVENEGDDLYIVIQTSDTISYKDKIEVVLPFGGVIFHPTGRSSASGTVRHDMEFHRDSGWYRPPPGLPRLAWLTWPMPIEFGDASPGNFLFDYYRSFGVTQLLANVPTEVNSLTTATMDSDGDGIADAQAIGPDEEIEVLSLDIATLNENAKVYLEYLVVEFYNQGPDADDDGMPDDEHFSTSIDLWPFTTDSATSGIGLYRDNPDGKDGTFDPDDDIPIQFDDPPDLIGVSGEPPIQVRMTFSSPGTDDWAGTDSPVNAPSPVDMEDQPELRQLVPTTFGRDENGNFISGDLDAGADFFVVIRTSDTLGLNNDFSVGIVSWGPDTPTGVDPDTFTAPPAPWQPSDEYEKFNENPWGKRGVGFIELITDETPPEPRAFTNLGGFDFMRTRATVQAETDILFATSGVVEPVGPGPIDPDPGPGPGPGLGGGGGGGGGCFIATAAFGTPYEEHVVTLTAFRDRYLLTNAGGTWFVRRYYRVSPRLADFVARHEVVRTVVRHALRPLAATARLCLTASAADKIAMLFGAVLFIAVVIRTRGKLALLAHTGR